MSQQLTFQTPEHEQKTPVDGGRAFEVVFTCQDSFVSQWHKKLLQYHQTQQKTLRMETLQYALAGLLLTALAFIAFQSLVATNASPVLTLVSIITLCVSCLLLLPVIVIKGGLRDRQFMLSRSFFTHGLSLEEQPFSISLIRNADHEIVARVF